MSNEQERRIRGIAKQIGILKKAIHNLKKKRIIDFLLGIIVGVLLSILIQLIWEYVV